MIQFSVRRDAIEPDRWRYQFQAAEGTLTAELVLIKEHPRHWSAAVQPSADSLAILESNNEVHSFFQRTWVVWDEFDGPATDAFDLDAEDFFDLLIPHAQSPALDKKR